ncbi:MAG: hypothetical protein LBV49_10765, partial [Azonexus sp.]|nr:hypothetical protein [Azonexus sp.]
MDLPKLMSQADIRRRWIYTRQGIVMLIKNDPEFPAPIATVNDGRTRLWRETDIAAYEQGKPWLFDEAEKIGRQAR